MDEIEANISKNSCKGKDSILVNPKQCMKGFYVPSGFTPNNDAKNDKLSSTSLRFTIVGARSFSIQLRLVKVGMEHSGVKDRIQMFLFGPALTSWKVKKQKWRGERQCLSGKNLVFILAVRYSIIIVKAGIESPFTQN